MNMSTSVGFIFSQKKSTKSCSSREELLYDQPILLTPHRWIWQGWTHGCEDGAQHLQLDLTFLHILLRAWTIFILRIGWADERISWDFMGFWTEFADDWNESCCVHRLHFRMISDDFRVLEALPLSFFEDWFNLYIVTFISSVTYNILVLKVYSW